MPLRRSCRVAVWFTGLLGVSVMTAGADAPASRPAEALSETQQKALADLVRSLESLRADPASLPRIRQHLRQERARLESSVSALEARARELQQQLDAANREKASAAARLNALRAGELLLADGAAPATQPAGAAVAAARSPAPAATPADPKLRLFTSEVRPVLVSQCFNCHSGQFKRGGLDLSTRETLLKGGDSGPAIVPGKAGDSLLHKLVTHAQDPHMPAKADKLPDAAIARIAEWIDAGAPYDAPLTAVAPQQAGGAASQPAQAQRVEHWAFKPVHRSAPPPVSRGDWIRNPIDAFVLAKLDAAGLKPSPEADRRALIRRLSLDLLGLLPKPSEVDEFVRDERPDAYERLVDRLLASPHYGERWARHWLDLARYADSDGYEKDEARPHAWRWRDWVINALNADMPFDQFTIEQLAGDLLPDASVEQRVATGFHRNTLTNKEGGVDQEEFRVKAVVDRVNTTGTVWLGLTVGCAQCHTHKYDPITIREYYQLFAFFNSSMEVNEPAPFPREMEAYRKAKAEYDAEHAKLVAALAAFEKEELPRRQAEWETQMTTEASWQVLTPVFASSAEGVTLAVQRDGSVLASGTTPETDSYTLVFRTELTGITALKIEALTHDTLPAKGPGRVASGNFVLSEVMVNATDLGRPDELGASYRVPLARAAADHFQTDKPWRPENTIDGKPDTGWAIGPQMGRDHVLVLETAQDIGGPGGTLLSVVLDQNYGDIHTLGRVRISVTTAKRPEHLRVIPEDVLAILKRPAEKRNAKQKERLTQYWNTIDPERDRLARAIEEHAKKAPAVPLAQLLVENPKPPKSHILTKGDFLRPGDAVQPATLSVLHPFKPRGAQGDRLDLARWLVDPANPLTARVTMNRMWRQLFGQAIVPSVDDFGTRSDPPSHPELLDWLASEFIARGWSQKAMLKLIVTSATYRQSSHVKPELLERDPKNVLLARQSRFRVEAEVVRDITLQAGGILNESIGGPSIRPPLPPDLAALVYASSLRWNESPAPDRYRRGLYIHFQRTIPYPMLMAFDEPDSNVACARRERSNTPLQSLTLLNDAEFFQCAQTLGSRALTAAIEPLQVDSASGAAVRLVADTKESGSSAASGATTRPAAGTVLSDEHLASGIRMIYRTCLSRDPDAFEIQRLARLWREISALARNDATAAEKMVGKPEVKLTSVQVPDAAAWVAVARTVMNLDEFVTRE